MNNELEVASYVYQYLKKSNALFYKSNFVTTGTSTYLYNIFSRGGFGPPGDQTHSWPDV
jgi:hypothetical protein